MKLQAFRAVIFDLDGVITDTAHYHYLAWKKLAEELGIPFDENFNEQLKGVDRMGSLQRILDMGKRTVPQQEMWVLADQKNRHYQQLIANMSPQDLLPGAVEALHMVRDAGLKIALASASQNARTVLNCLGITDCFDVIVDVAQIARGKPDPEIFLSAASQLGVAPSQCLGVEDAVAGVRAIKSANMHALGIGDPVLLHESDWVISGMREFGEVFL